MQRKVKLKDRASFYWFFLCLLRTNKGTNWRNESTVDAHRNSDWLWKTPSKFVVNQNLENLDEISFREFLGGIIVFFALTINFCEVTTVRLYKNMNNFSDKTANNKICNIEKHTYIVLFWSSWLQWGQNIKIHQIDLSIIQREDLFFYYFFIWS